MNASFKRTVCAATMVILAFGTLGAAAPPPTPTGCGDIENGQLCVDGPAPKAGTYTTKYWRSGKSGEVTVRLGYEMRVEASEKSLGRHYWKDAKTKNGLASRSGHANMSAARCIRGIMIHDGKFYKTKWDCGD